MPGTATATLHGDASLASAHPLGAMRVCDVCADGFRWEADMLAPLARELRVAVGPVAGAVTTAGRLRPGWTTLYELQATYGIVDVLHVLPDVAAWSARLGRGLDPLTSHVDLALVLRADAGGAGATLAELTVATDLSAATLRRRWLPGLVERGHLRVDGARYITTHRYRQPMRSLVAIEAKVASWRRALEQAARYARFADASYVALDARGLRAPTDAAPMFEHMRVGLLSVSACERRGCLTPERTVVRLVTAPPVTTPIAFERALVAERAWAMLLAGTVSGPLPRVFGRTHATTHDPRVTT